MLSSEEKEATKQVSNEEEEPGSDEDDINRPICRLSQPAHPHTLSLQAEVQPPGTCFVDGDKLMDEDDLCYYYYCATCDVKFHEDCFKQPRKMIHPYHPQHPLVLSAWLQRKGVRIPALDKIFHDCTWCGKFYGDAVYRCSICNFCLCRDCSETFPLPSIKNPKNHHHSLIFLPRPLLLPCDACGVVDRSEPSYACFECNLVVHRSCIDLPRVIKLTRHPHRLFYTPCSLSLTISTCRICYKTDDVKYGHYSCNHDECSFVVHSKCATHERVWDGRELEWEPEEFGEAEDVASFKKVGADLIKYFFHDHHLNLYKYDAVRDADKQCEACILHIDSRDFYNCMQCGFFLHEACANLPRKLDHASHNHPLVLDPTPPQDLETMGCMVCTRGFVGFRYKCSKVNCEQFQVDVGCILVPDCFTHKNHEHPLFIPIPPRRTDMLLCEGSCKELCFGSYIKCTVCPYLICYCCAAIPDKLHNKYDAHNPLSLIYGEDSVEKYWCEICEKELDPSKWFYTCSKVYTTIHLKCVFGNFVYMKPGTTVCYKSFRMEVICNDNNTRPICHICNSRCSSSVYLKWFDEMVICSFACLLEASERMSETK